MLIPLGFFGAGDKPGAMELIATQTVGVTGSVTFSSIPQDFKHIKLVWNANEYNDTTNWRNLVVNLNGDYGQQYFNNSIVSSFSSTPSAQNGTYSSSGNYAYFKQVIRSNNTNVTGPQWTYGEMWMPNYSATSLGKRTIAVRGGLAARNSAFLNYVASASYQGTSPINAITLRIRWDETSYNTFLNFMSGSSFSLYGYRG